MIPDVSLAPPRYEYLSVRELCRLMGKSKSRIYAMKDEGLLEEVGFIVVRDSNRIWIGVPQSFMNG